MKEHYCTEVEMWVEGGTDVCPHDCTWKIVPRKRINGADAVKGKKR